MKNDAGIRGVATIRLLGPNGDLKFYEVKKNLITDFGDEYYARKGANASPPTAVSNMQLGTGTTAVAKSGAAATIVTFEPNSGVAFDSAAAVSEVGTNQGWKIRYTTTWAAGVATETAITEAVITSESGANVAAVEGNTIARVVFTAINKGNNDTLVINWDHTFLDSL